METIDVDFQSIDDVKEAAQKIVEFANDACCAHLFEVGRGGESNLFFIDDERRKELAATIEPDLKSHPTFDDLSENLPDDIQERLLEIVMDTAEGFFAIGMVVGAREADPTGRNCERVANGWLKATLVKPRYRGLEPRAKTVSRDGESAVRRKRGRPRKPTAPVAAETAEVGR